MIGPENIRQPLNQLQLDVNRGLVIRVFARFRQFHYFHFEFSLVKGNVNLCSDWSLGLLWFGFVFAQLKTALIVCENQSGWNKPQILVPRFLHYGRWRSGSARGHATHSLH